MNFTNKSCLKVDASSCQEEMTIEYFIDPTDFRIAGSNDYYSPNDDTDVQSNLKVNSRRSTTGWIYDSTLGKESKIGSHTLSDIYIWTEVPGYIHINRTQIMNIYNRLILQVSFPVIQDPQGELIFPEIINGYDIQGRPCVISKANDRDQSSRRYWQVSVYNRGSVVF